MTDSLHPSAGSALSEPQLDRLIHHVPDMFCIAGFERFEWVSPQWECFVGWSTEELLSKPFMDFVHPADRQRTIDETSRLAEGLTTVQFENRYVKPDGSYCWLEWSASPADDGLLYCTVREVTKRKKAEQLARERTKLMEMSETIAGVGHWRVDLTVEEGLFWSPQVYTIHGRDPEVWEPTLEEAVDHYHPEDRDMVGAAVQAAIEQKEPFAFEARIVRPSGEVRSVRSQGVAEVNSDGDVVAIFGVFKDVTEEKSMQQALLHSERMVSLGTLAAGMAHEINNPLGYISGNIELAAEFIEDLREKVPADQADEVLEVLRHALDGSHRIRKIVEGMGTFSRVGDSKREPTSVRQVVKSALEITEHRIRNRAQIVTRIEPAFQVMADENQLVQVLVNLLVNSSQAIPPGDALVNRVEVVLRNDGDDVFIRVSDTGPGVPEDVKARIFDPFFTTKPIGVGTGLGLSISNSIILSLGGSFEVLDRPGGGASFVIRLPGIPGVVEDGDAAIDAGEKDNSSENGHRRVLVVDDEPQILNFLTRALRREFHVATAASGREALEEIEHDPTFVAVLCDLMMPDMTGMELYQELETNHPELLSHFLVVTGGAFTPEAEAFLKARPELQVFKKPVNLQEVRDAVRSIAEANGAPTGSS